SRDISLAANAEPITVQTFAEHKVHAVPSHQDGEKTNHARHDKTKFCPPTSEPPVQRQNITEQRDQGPRFLRIPAPESAPGIIRPHAAKNRARSQQKHAKLEVAIK